MCYVLTRTFATAFNGFAARLTAVQIRTLQGLAPGAALVGVKVLDGTGCGHLSGVIAGIEWVIEHKDEYNIKVLKTNRFKLRLTMRS